MQSIPSDIDVFRTLLAVVNEQTVVKEHIGALLDGCFLTVFAYGQTGSGKTFTMDSLITHTVKDVFALLFRTKKADCVTVGVSYFEVYLSKVIVAPFLRALRRRRPPPHTPVVALPDRCAVSPPSFMCSA